jgi:hypothetical protein
MNAIRRKLLVVGLLIGINSFTGRPIAQAPATTLHGIGDLPGGGVGSAVRDATRVGGTIYAVGASTVNATGTVPQLDTPALWTWPGSGNGTLEALPYFAGVTNTQTTPRTAYAITPDGDYLASQAQPTATSTGTRWVRVTRNLLPSTTANEDLNAGTGAAAFAALAISDSGDAVYGQQTAGVGTPTETRFPVRYESGVGLSFPDLTPTGKTSGYPIPRGTSADGLLMVGVASDGPVVVTTTPGGPTGGIFGTNAVAFRYVHDTGMLTGTTSLIPTLPGGGTWNMPVAISATGDQTLVIGNSTNYPSGEVYLTDASNTITATLGSPNTAWMPRALGGMTADGNVVAVTFAGTFNFGPGQIAGLGIPPDTKYAYIHNSRGWFHFSSILLSEGIDLAALGWDPTNLAITGIRTIDGVDLVFGQGRRRTAGPFPNGGGGYINGAVEGFVAELPQGVLASFNPQPTPPSDSSLVGAWISGDPATSTLALAFMADGTSYRITQTGFERGLYTWAGNANGGAFTLITLHDTDGGGGSNRNGQSGLSFIVSGHTATFDDAHCDACGVFQPLTRVTGSPGSIVGGWAGGHAAQADNSFMSILLDSNAGLKYFAAYDNPGTDSDAAELGTYTWDPVSHELIATTGGVVDVGNFVTPSSDGLSLHVVDDEGDVFDLLRVIDPTAIPVIANTPLTANGGVGQPFSFGIAATNAATFTATGLPAGLFINPITGELSGTPAVGGQFAVTIFATNADGVSDIETLALTIASPSSTSIGSSLNPATYGQAVTLTATVTSSAGVPGGSVAFTDGASALGSATLNAGGQATLTVNLGAGMHALSAIYGGSPQYLGSVAAGLVQSIATATTTTGLTSSPNPSQEGQQVDFVATVTGQYGGAVTGNVTFRRGMNVVLGTTPLVNGTATLPVSSLGNGSHAVTAIYSGDANSTGSTSPSVTQTVTARTTATTTTALSSSPNPSAPGQPVTFSIGVTSSAGSIPTGLVTLKEGNTTLGTATLDAAGNASVILSSLAAQRPPHNIKAQYAGDANHSNSTSNTVQQIVR